MNIAFHYNKYDYDKPSAKLNAKRSNKEDIKALRK